MNSEQEEVWVLLPVNFIATTVDLPDDVTMEIKLKRPELAMGSRPILRHLMEVIVSALEKDTGTKIAWGEKPSTSTPS